MKLNFETTIYSLMSLIATVACSASPDGQGAKATAATANSDTAILAAQPTTAVLQARATAGQTDNYSDATFSFQYMTHDQNVTRNDYDIEFSGTKVSTIQVVDNVGVIVDLGAISCADIKNSYEQSGPYPGKGHGGYPYKQDRTQDPMFWFEYSDAMNALQGHPSSSSVDVAVGHCYLVNKLTNNRRVLAVFHVQDLVLNKSLSIDEIEVFKRQVFQGSN